MTKTFNSSKAYVNHPNHFKGPQYFGDHEEESYAEFKENGFLRLVGTAAAWDDLRFPATAINPVGNVSPMSFDTANIGFLASPATTQSIAIVAQMPHAWKLGSAIVPHIHWMPTTTSTLNVLWRLEYKWTNVYSVESESWAIIDTLASASGVPFKHQIASFGVVSGEGKTLSSLLTLKVSRIGGDAADDYAGDALLKEFDLHYQIDSIGSQQEYSK